MLRIVPFMIVGAIFVVAAFMKAISPHGLVGFLEFVSLPPGNCSLRGFADRGG